MGSVGGSCQSKLWKGLPRQPSLSHNKIINLGKKGESRIIQEGSICDTANDFQLSRSRARAAINHRAREAV